MRNSVMLPKWLVLVSAALPSALVGCDAAVETGEVALTDQSLIYGTDDRLEYGQLQDAVMLRVADSTASLVNSSSVTCLSGTCRLTTNSWTTDPKSTNPNRLCSSVHYRGQPALGNCSGVLVAPDLLATAGHCINTNSCANTSIVFDYNANSNGANAPTSLPDSSVYRCSAVTSIYPTEDWALVKLDRAVPRPIMNVRYTDSVGNGTGLAILGYPYGIPMKISPTGEVTSVSDTVSFSHNVESFAGNSGSPVIDRSTGTVEGIHVTPPAEHFFASADTSGPCVAERVCPTTGCPGYSGATRVTRFSSQVPLAPALVVATLS